MNYQHVYHAGNFADVLKHIILIQILKSLQSYRKPIFVLDTHAGRGRYNLKSLEAKRSGEYLLGIKRLLDLPVDMLPKSLVDYISVVQDENATDDLVFYPGSPKIIQDFLRPQDRAAFCECNDTEFFKLHALCHQNKNVKLVCGDGYEALMSFLPPKEKQGLVLIDPPFEQRDEILLLEKHIIKSLKRWPNGIFMLWYPVKEPEQFNTHYQNLKNSGINCTLFELEMPEYYAPQLTGLRKTAVIVFNPPQELLDVKLEIDDLSNILFPAIEMIDHVY